MVAVMVTTLSRAVARARVESAARALSELAVVGTTGCCAAAHTGATMHAHRNNRRNMVSASLEVGSAGVSRLPARAMRTPQGSAANEERRTEGRRETKRERLARTNDLRRMRDDRGDP